MEYKKGDLLEVLLDNHDNKLHLNAIFDGKQKSKMALARKSMMQHLKLDNEAELSTVLSTIRIQHSKPGISSLIKEQLNTKLMLAGLKPLDFKVLVNPYNDLIVNCASKEVNALIKIPFLSSVAQSDCIQANRYYTKMMSL